MTFCTFSHLQTGPKGVIKDYQRFKQLERERREEQKEELAILAKKFSITCRTNVILSKPEYQVEVYFLIIFFFTG